MRVADCQESHRLYVPRHNWAFEQPSYAGKNDLSLTGNIQSMLLSTRLGATPYEELDVQ